VVPFPSDKPEQYPRPKSFLFGADRRKEVDMRAVARARRGNPVWQWNRPLRRGRRRTAVWVAVVAGAPLLMAAVAAVSCQAEAGGGGVALTFLGIFLLQLILGSGMVRWFDFVGRRREILEDLGVTPLTPEEIAYGSFASGVRGSLWILGGLLAVELGTVCFGLGSLLIVSAVLLVLFLAPLQVLLQCAVVESALESRSDWGTRFSIRRALSAVVAVVQTTTHWAAYFIAMLITAAGSMFQSEAVFGVSVALALGLLGLYAWFLGRHAIETGYRKAGENYRKALEGK